MKVKSQQVKKELLKTLDLEKPENSNLDTDDEDDEISLDSDQELQLAFARKELTPGLNIQLDKPKQYVNDEAGLERKLKDFYLKMDWIERMDITVPKLVGISSQEMENDTAKEFVDNDFKRESYFLKQAEAAVQMALPRLKGFGVLTKRPEDYFAEMSKSDNHMKKVRETLLTKHAEIEKREKIRKLRELKKMGKQIQIENEKKKQQGKKVYKSEKQFIDSESGESKGKKPTQRKDGKPDKKNKLARKKASFKNEKFGFGGRKKRGKYNTAESYAEAYNNPVNKKKKSPGNKKMNTKTKFVNKNKPKKFSKNKK